MQLPSSVACALGRGRHLQQLLQDQRLARHGADSDGSKYFEDVVDICTY